MQEWQFIDPPPERDRLLDSALDSVSAARADRVIRTYSQQPQEALWYGGRRNGRAIVRDAAGRELPATRAITNGSIAVGSPVVGQRDGQILAINQMPRVFEERPPGPNEVMQWQTLVSAFGRLDPRDNFDPSLFSEARNLLIQPSVTVQASQSRATFNVTIPSITQASGDTTETIVQSFAILGFRRIETPGMATFNASGRSRGSTNISCGALRVDPLDAFVRSNSPDSPPVQPDLRFASVRTFEQFTPIYNSFLPFGKYIDPVIPRLPHQGVLELATSPFESFSRWMFHASGEGGIIFDLDAMPGLREPFLQSRARRTALASSGTPLLFDLPSFIDYDGPISLPNGLWMFSIVGSVYGVIFENSVEDHFSFLPQVDLTLSVQFQ